MLNFASHSHREVQHDYDPRGWYLGSEQFRDEFLAQVGELAEPTHRDVEVRESAEAKAKKIVTAELKKLNWSAQDLLGRRKGDPQKLRIAAQLRAETTMSLA